LCYLRPLIRLTQCKSAMVLSLKLDGILSLTNGSASWSAVLTTLASILPLLFIVSQIKSSSRWQQCSGGISKALTAVQAIALLSLALAFPLTIASATLPSNAAIGCAGPGNCGGGLNSQMPILTGRWGPAALDSSGRMAGVQFHTVLLVLGLALWSSVGVQDLFASSATTSAALATLAAEEAAPARSVVVQAAPATTTRQGNSQKTRSQAVDSRREPLL